jgi:hypothetical protein
MNDQPVIDNAPPKRRRLLRFMGVAIILLILLVLAAPWIIANTTLRDQLANTIIGTPNLTTTSKQASFGWFSSASVDGITIDSKEHHVRIEVEKVVTDRSWPKLFASSPHLGTITVDKPHIFVDFPIGKLGERTKLLEPTCTAVVRNGALTVRLPEFDQPVIDIDGINMTLHIEEANEGRILRLDPVQIFKQRQMKPEIANKLLQIMAPSLADATHAEGQYSLSIEKFRIPFEMPKDYSGKRIEMEGKLELHQVSIESKSSLVRAFVKLLADLYGKDAPESIRVVKNTEVRFHVRDGRMYHEGLELGFPDISPKLLVRSSGSVGLDRSLDLVMEVPRLGSTKTTEKGPIQCRITGTINKPRLDVKDASLVVRSADAAPPLLDVDGVDLSLGIEGEKGVRVLTLAPGKILDKQKLSAEFNQHLLFLVAPTVENAPDVTGEVSLWVEKLSMPLGVSREQRLKETEMSGKLQLHDLTTKVKTPTVEALVSVLADLYGKEPNDVVRVVKNAEIKFKLQNGRMYHEGLELGFPDISPKLVIRSSGSVGLDKSLDLVLEVPRLGTAKSKEKGPVKCHVTGTLSKPKLDVKDASLVIHSADSGQPLLDVDGVDLSLGIEGEKGARVLTMAPTQLLNKQKLSAEFNQQLLLLIAPTVENAPDVKGEVSLWVEKLRMPLGVSREQRFKQTEMSGKIQLHELTTTIKRPLVEVMVKVLADLYGKKTTDVVRVVENAEIRFQLRDGRMHHEGLELGFPDISPKLVVRSSGSVGLDKSLDLVLEIPRLDSARGKEKGPIQCHITGTLSRPKLDVKGASLVIYSADAGRPLLDVDGVDVSLSIEGEKDARVLTMAPVKLLDKQKLSAEFNQRLLQLVAPTVNDVLDVKGEVSLWVEKLHMPLRVSPDQLLKRTELSGKLQLHELTTTVKTPLLEAMVKVLADNYGKKPTDVVRVVKNAEIRFQLRDGRMHHEGLELGFPDISPKLLVRSSGSVGLDRSLDLVLEVPRILVKAKEPDDKADKIRFKVTGTIEKPNVVEIKAK